MIIKNKDIDEIKNCVNASIRELNWTLEESKCKKANNYAMNCIHYLLHTALPLLSGDVDDAM